VNIEPPCVIEAIGFDWCPEPFREPTPAEVLAEAQVTCDCDETPMITDIHVIHPGNGNDEPAEWGYTITCTSDNGCITTMDGIFTACQPNICPCQPLAPSMCACKDEPLTDADFIANGVKCQGENCPAPIIDDTQIDYSKLGTYSYTVSCGDGCGLATGKVCVRYILCGPQIGTYATTTLLAGQQYTAGTVTVSLDNQGYLVVDMNAAQGTVDCGNWAFTDTGAVYIGLSPTATCSPGQFPYKDPVISTPTHIQYKVRLTDIPGYICVDEPMIYVDAHATMTSNCGGQTAWAVAPSGHCEGGCGWPQTPVGEICFQIPCNCECPQSHCPPCKG
jgi:hypothetical protein